MPALFIYWNTHIDERTCLRCGFLNGHRWAYFTAKQQFPEYLPHLYWGNVWDCRRDEPLIHGDGSRRGPWYCRCWLVWTLDTTDQAERLRNHKETMRLMAESLRGLPA